MANFKLTQTGEQIQSDLNLLDSNSATQGQVLTANGTGGASWQNASGGSGSGSQVGGGYTFSCSSDMHTMNYWIFGTLNGTYGWHHINDDNYSSFNNVSFVVFEDMNPPSGELTTLTNNALYTFDGTPINTYSNLSSAVGKLCYLRQNCTITFMD